MVLLFFTGVAYNVSISDLKLRNFIFNPSWGIAIFIDRTKRSAKNIKIADRS
ncbi:MAG: hypothetical protein F6K40_07670 [Okeania sp. SIO3I5]|nr:hypothetical protein [Okeania sp. SIO3I5]